MSITVQWYSERERRSIGSVPVQLDVARDLGLTPGQTIGDDTFHTIVSEHHRRLCALIETERHGAN